MNNKKNMKKILLSLAMIAMVSAVAVGATKAYFTSEATISGETFSSGTVTLNITGDDTYQNGSNRTVVQDHFDNLKPGDTMRQWITLHNSGSLPIDYLTVDKGTPTDPNGLLSQIIVSTSCGLSGTDPAFFTDDWGTKPTISTWFSNSNILDNPTFYRPAADKIDAGQDYVCVMDFTLPTTVGNLYQEATASFDMTFTAEQVH